MDEVKNKKVKKSLISILAFLLVVVALFSAQTYAFLTDSNHFTDDSLMTLGIARAFVLERGKWNEPGFQQKVIDSMVHVAKPYINRGWWGANFYQWLTRSQTP